MTKATRGEDLRHNQLFELIRQKHRADKTVLRKKDKMAPKATPADIESLKHAATRSLQASA